MGQQQQQERKRRVRPGAFGAALIGLIGLSSSAICCSAAIIVASNSRSSSTKEGVERIRKLYVRRGDGEAISQSFETEDEKRQLSVDSTLHVPFLQQLALTKPPGPLLLSPDRKNLYTVTGESLLAFKTLPGGALEQIQELKDGVVDKYGNTVQYFTGLTAVTASPEGDNVYAVGTSVMPGIGGITVLARDQSTGELSIAQQFRIDQRAGILDIDGMIGANSVAVSPDGRFTYVSSGGYYRDHNLLAFSRDKGTGGHLTLIQNIDVYNTSASRVLPSTLIVSPDGSNVYVVGDNFAISTSVIMVYSVDKTTGQLTQVQEAGPLRSTLLTSVSFDPSGKYLYVTASFGSNLVWVFARGDGGLLTVVTDPVEAGGRPTPSPQGSYSAPLAVSVPGLGDVLFIAVQKDNMVYVAHRNESSGRLSYFSTALGESATPTPPSPPPSSGSSRSAPAAAAPPTSAPVNSPPPSSPPSPPPPPPRSSPATSTPTPSGGGGGGGGGNAAQVPTTPPADPSAINRPVAVAFDPTDSTLYVSEDVQNAISSFKIGV